MNRVRAALLAPLVVLSFAAQGAEVTRIASSFEEADPFDLYLDVGFDRTQTRMLISREAHDGADTILKKELRYTGVDTRLNLDLHVGLWRDVEFSFGIPIDFADNETWQFAYGTNAGNSTITTNCLNPDGTAQTSCSPLFQMPADGAKSFRGGLGNMRFGMAYAPFNQNRDDTKPTWVVGLDYEAPTSARMDPTVPATALARGRIGDRIHKYTLYTAFSRKMGIADPYFRAYWTVPYRGPHWYSNCDADPSLLSNPGNCTATGSGWDRSSTGIQSPMRMGMVFGSEFVIYDQVEKRQRIALDFRAVTDYVGEGRYYNPMSGVLHKLLYTDAYLKFGGQLGLNALASDYVSLRISGKLLYQTDHYLTAEAPATADQLGDNGQPPATGATNPTFDYRYDLTGRRFRASEINEFNLDITATFSF